MHRRSEEVRVGDFRPISRIMYETRCNSVLVAGISIRCRTFVDSLYTCCATNSQQIEPVEFDKHVESETITDHVSA